MTSSSEFFGLTLIVLWIGFLVGNWLPVTDLGSAASVRGFEIAILFLLLSGVMTWLSSKKPKGISTVRELDAALKSPKAQQELADAVYEHRQNIRVGQ